MKRRLFKGALAAVLAAGFALSPIHITELQAAPTVFHERLQTQAITLDTYLHRVLRMTSSGVVDISVLEMPLDNPLLDVSVFNSNEEFGLRQPTTTLLGDNGAIAGINGDFFGLSGRHSVSLGLEMIGGQMSIQGGVNRYGNNSASLLMGDAGAFIDYVRPNVNLHLNGENIFSVGLVNMVTNLAWPSFLTYGYITSTASIDARLGRSYKLLVEDGRITAITHYTVNVPQNGFVVIMNTETFYENEDLFYRGQAAEMIVTANVNLAAIDMAISGTNRILNNGQVTDAAQAVRERQPRTLLGLNEARDRLILMTIDGRGRSIGASLPEAATYMRQFGAHYAINLDGGGSTTMAATVPGGTLSLVNTPSDGSQRAVINAIGLVNNSVMGPVTSLRINVPQNIAVGMTTPLQVFGYDDFLNRVTMPLNELAFTIANGSIVDGSIIPQNAGEVIITASHGENYIQQQFNAIQVAEIVPSVQTLTETASVTFRGYDNLGHSVQLSAAQLSFEVFPQSLGTFAAGQFTSAGPGIGWARAFTPTASVFIPINVYRESRQINALENARIAYTFAQSDNLQSAHMDLLDPPHLNAVGYRLTVYGNNSGHALLGRVLDNEGLAHYIEFSDNINFTGNRNLTAQVPAEAAHPVRLLRLYVVSETEEESAAYELAISNLRVYELMEGEPATTPASTIARDPLHPQTLAERTPYGHDITFMGPMAFTGDRTPYFWETNRNAAIAGLARDSAIAFYGGPGDIRADLDIPTHLLTNSFASTEINNIAYIRMFARNSGFTAANGYQWGHLQRDLANSSKENIVIHTGVSPLEFTNWFERDIFHDIVAEQAAAGRNVFVISNGGNHTTAELRDGVRYINLASLFIGPYRNDDFAVLRFRFDQGGLQYTLERIFD
ncbi:MAG: phosphodiester glycosidase family protein [Defluviitaleaceae bacterium]|nr:phosphodiester glycosidase family protein [Defluviitaleaceae bacterium]